MVKYIDIINGGTATDHIVAGTTVSVIAVYDFVAGTDTATVLQNCFTDIYSTRALGSSCPGISAPNYLESVTPETIGASQVRMRLNYKGLPALQIEIGTCLTQADSNTDKDGNVIFVTYNYPAGYTQNPQNAGVQIKQGGMISKQIQETTFSLKYIVGALGTPMTSGYQTASAVVLNFAQTYVGTVNMSVWGSAPGGARCWLCESVRGVSHNGGLTYEVTTTFHYRKGYDSSGAGGWDFLLIFINPDDGKPPSDLVKDVGYKHVRGYTEGTLPVMPPT